MAGIFGQLQPFKEGENWQEHVEIFEHFFMANDSDSDGGRCSDVPGRVGTTRWSLLFWTVCHASIA